jgi:amidohydrolase
VSSTVESLKQRVEAAIRAHESELISLSERIHGSPEVAFEERLAAGWVAEALEQYGYCVEKGAYDVETAVKAETGDGALLICICAEYDALPRIGHACGHNIIAAAAVGAAAGLALAANDLSLRVRVLGTPGEEAGDAGGKILLLERGAWEGVHMSMMIHPGPFNDATPGLIAISAFDIEYVGKEVHATTFANLGVNAGAAAIIAEVAIAELRQQLVSTDKVHGYIETYGSSANTLSGYSRLRYMIRGRSLTDLENLRGRVLRCFEAGALATGATLAVKGGTKPYAPMKSDEPLARLFIANESRIGRTFPNIGEGPSTYAGTDMGNVSELVPTIHPMLSLDSFPIVNHQAEFATISRGAAANRAIIDGAVGMALTAVDAAMTNEVRSRLESVK